MQLVINSFGASLRKQGDRFLVQAGERKLEVSAHKVQSILISTAAHLSTDAIELASVHNIDLVFLDKFGDPYARVWQPKLGSTAAIRRRQLEAADGPEGVAVARESRRPPAFLRRLEEGAFPRLVEQDAVRSAIFRALLEKVRLQEAEKEKGEQHH